MQNSKGKIMTVFITIVIPLFLLLLFQKEQHHGEEDRRELYNGYVMVKKWG